MLTEREEARLAVSRNAARLFLDHGVAGTSGDDIAAASGLSKRTVWRYFRSKENCVEPLLSMSASHLIAFLRLWPRDQSIEDYLDSYIVDLHQHGLEDYILAARIIALLPEEPPLRSTWLMACAGAEEQLLDIVRERADASVEPFELRLCAAAISAAMRVMDEELCLQVIKRSRKTTAEAIKTLSARIIRAVATLPICDAQG
jgi:AcrR family transcriptional regulator